jgi:hypothetical protein
MFGIYTRREKHRAEVEKKKKKRHHSQERKRNSVVWEVGDAICK